MQKRSERAAQFRRQVVFANGLQQRERGLVGFELRDAAGTLGEVAFQIRMHLGRQVMFEIVREQPYDVGAGTVVRRMGHRGSRRVSTPNSQRPTPQESRSRVEMVGSWELEVGS